mgnify:CR=1 FL=1
MSKLYTLFALLFCLLTACLCSDSCRVQPPWRRRLQIKGLHKRSYILWKSGRTGSRLCSGVQQYGACLWKERKLHIRNWFLTLCRWYYNAARVLENIYSAHSRHIYTIQRPLNCASMTHTAKASSVQRPSSKISPCWEWIYLKKNGKYIDRNGKAANGLIILPSI